MDHRLRRVRAALILGALWAAGLGALGLALGLGTVLWSGAPPVPPDVATGGRGWPGLVLRGGAGFGAFGALAGVGFAAMLARAERGRQAAALSGPRVALWGALAGGALYVGAFVLPPWARLPGAPWARVAYPLVPVLLFAALGAACAWLTLVLARRAAPCVDADAEGAAHAAARRWPNESLQLTNARSAPHASTAPAPRVRS